VNSLLSELVAAVHQLRDAQRALNQHRPRPVNERLLLAEEVVDRLLNAIGNTPTDPPQNPHTEGAS